MLYRIAAIGALVVTAGMVGAASVFADSSSGELSLSYFQHEVQPLFLVKRTGNIACATCHAGAASSNFRLQPLKPGTFFWDAEQTQKNFDAAKQFVSFGKPLNSRLLTHPLATAAGGDPFHGGGKHFASQRDPEWLVLRDWAMGAKQRAAIKKTAVRIVQTNAAGNGAHVIDPVSNKVVGVISDVDIPHGVTHSSDGRYVFLSNESLHTLDAIDSRTLRVWRRIPLSGRPNNVATGKDGRFVYVGIMEMPGAVDVIDTQAFERVKTVPVNGAIHNVYVTPDGKFVVAGSIQTSTINVVDVVTQELAWTYKMDAGIRPMTFDTHPDGSTKNIYVQLSNFHGFAVVDFNARKEIARIEHPAIASVHAHYDGLQSAPAHGLGIPANGKQLWSTSKVYGYAYVHSLPELKEIGRVFVGQHPEWVTFTPDGKFAYIGAAGDNQTFVVDVAKLKEVARIPVGQVPKRIATVTMAVE